MIPQLCVNRRLRMRRPLFRPNERGHHVLRKRSRCDLPGVDAGSNFRTRPPDRPPESRRRNSPPRPPTNAALRAQVLRACACHTSDRHCPHRRTIPVSVATPFCLPSATRADGMGQKSPVHHGTPSECRILDLRHRQVHRHHPQIPQRSGSGSRNEPTCGQKTQNSMSTRRESQSRLADRNFRE